jgi:hypothetical protein
VQYYGIRSPQDLELLIGLSCVYCTPFLFLVTVTAHVDNGMVIGLDPIVFCTIARIPFWEMIRLFLDAGYPLLPFDPDSFKQAGDLYFHVIRVPPLRPVPKGERSRERPPPEKRKPSRVEDPRERAQFRASQSSSIDEYVQRATVPTTGLTKDAFAVTAQKSTVNSESRRSYVAARTTGNRNSSRYCIWD